MSGAKKVAVVAVHGVGDHAPFAAASDLTHLLGRLRDEKGEPCYGRFREEIVHIPVEPCPVSEVKNGDPAHRFTHEALKDFRDAGPTNTYRTIRLSCTEPPGNAERVDVWEMHWADLSQVHGGIVSFLVDLYHLILNLPVVATHTLHADVGEGIVARLSIAVRWLLTHAIPLFNLVLLGLGLTVVVIAPAAVVGDLLMPWTVGGWVTVLWGLIAQQLLLRSVPPAALAAMIVAPGIALGWFVGADQTRGLAAGRSLWREEDDFRAVSLQGEWKPVNALTDLDPKATPDGFDFCLGPGAHTQYWGDHAEGIAVLTDLLISEAIPRAKVEHA